MERKKLIWIIVSTCVFLAAVAIVGIVILDPQGRNPDAPAFSRPSPRGSANAYLPSPSPSPRPIASPGDQIIAFGENTSPAPISTLSNGNVVTEVLPASSQAPGSAGSNAGTTGDRPAASERPAIARATPKPTPKPSAKPASTPKPAAASASRSAAPRAFDYWIQTMSLASRGKADDHKAFLADKGLSSIITTTKVDGETRYRVRIGPFSTLKEANGWLDRVRALEGCKDAFTIQSPR